MLAGKTWVIDSPSFPAGKALNVALPRRIFAFSCSPRVLFSPCQAQGSLRAEKAARNPLPAPCAAPHSFPTGTSSTKERCCRLKTRESNFITKFSPRREPSPSQSLWIQTLPHPHVENRDQDPAENVERLLETELEARIKKKKGM